MEPGSQEGFGSQAPRPPAELAPAYVHLAPDESRYTIGALYRAHGGMPIF